MTMSVFDLPRLHFGGTAVTRLPTGPRSGLLDQAQNQAITDEGPFPVDRPATEYHAYLDRRGPRFDQTGQPAVAGVFSMSKGWNFGGNGHFWVDAVIVSAEGPEGLEDSDPVVGRAVDMWGHYNEYLATTANRARVFDVDPASNWTTTLMVGQFCFGRSGRSHDTGYMVVGDVSGMHPPRWHNPAHVVEKGPHILDAQLRRSVVHQFVVTADEGLAWLDEAAASPTVTRLRSMVESTEAAGLVVQFALTNMAPPTVPDTPDRWELRGTIAPWYPHEMRSYPAGRLLTPRAAGRTGRPATLHNATVEVRDGQATLNMVTAVPVRSREPGQGDRWDAGDLELRTACTGRLVARVPRALYRSAGFDLTSGIVTVAAELPSGVDDEGLTLVGTAEGGERAVLLAEEQVNLQTDDAALFLQQPGPDEDQAVEVRVRSYVRGRPAAVPSMYVRQFVNPRSRPLDPLAGVARCGDVEIAGVRPGRLDTPGDFGPSCTISTDSDGVGWVTVQGVRAGAGRLLLARCADDLPSDGGVPGSAATAYDNDDELGYWGAAGSAAVRVLPNDWHLDRVPTDEVTFELVYREVFAYYELLYSFMKAEVFSLADECKVKTYPRLIWQMCDPANRGKTYYMPPTRDMSDPKARLLLRFLRAQQQVTDVPVVVPEPRISDRITTRGQLWTALKYGTTVELAVMLQYLYAAYSVPTYGAGEEYVRRGLWTPEQLRLACGDGGRTRDAGIRGTLLSIAREEMIHFLLVNNIIMAMGEPFHVPDVDFGTINNTLPVPLDFCLEALGVGSVQRFIAIERPEEQIGEIHRSSVPGLSSAVPAANRSDYRYATLSELYGDIREGLQRVPDVFMIDKGRGGGEHHLFLRKSINAAHPDYQLQVDDLNSALFAIDVVTEQGEGNKLAGVQHSGDSHFDSFLRVSDLLMAEQMAGTRERRPPWTPAYPVLRNPTLAEGNANRELVVDPDARAVMQLFNRSYFMMFQLMVQHFGHTPDASLRRSVLMNAAIDVMTGLLSPLGELLVTMPSGRRGSTAGPSFELPDRPLYNSRPDVAMRSVALRFEHLAAAARKCDPVPERVRDLLAFYAERFRELGGASGKGR
jgi:hypothetical protein